VQRPTCGEPVKQHAPWGQPGPHHL